jgi:predicted nucleotide-binding protein (sugar kinase/HSP70/actin superfamily)
MRDRIARKFVDMIAGYPKLHTVRFLYDKDNSANRVAERIVERSAKEVKNYMMKLLDSGSTAIDRNSTDLTIFVVDRSIDVITPILHGYAY